MDEALIIAKEKVAGSNPVFRSIRIQIIHGHRNPGCFTAAGICLLRGDQWQVIVPESVNDLPASGRNLKSADPSCSVSLSTPNVLA